MVLCSSIEKYLSQKEVKKLEKRFSKRTDLDEILSNSINKLFEISDFLEVPFDDVKKCFILDNRFLYTNFKEKLEQAQNVYGDERRADIVQAVLKQPNFLRSNHQRVIEDKELLARYILQDNFNPTNFRSLILNKPHIICYAKNRDEASIEVGREAQNNLGSTPQHVLRYIRKSPRVKVKKDIYSLSQAREVLRDENFEMPEMYRKIERSFLSYKN